MAEEKKQEKKAEETKAEAKAAEEKGAPAEPAKPKGPDLAPEGFRYILGEKLGMTQIFDGKGQSIPVTALRLGPCPVVSVRTPERDGHGAVQIGFREIREKSANKAELGHFKKAGVKPLRYLREFRSKGEGFAVGQLVTLEKRFKPADYVDVGGRTKGKGFAGVMKRHGFSGLPASHGASDKIRSPGSIASRRSLGRVVPGQSMAGHMGAVWETTPHCEVVKVVPEENLLYVKGAVPGPARGLVVVCETTRSVKFKTVRKKDEKKETNPLKLAKIKAQKGFKKKK